MHQRLTWVGGGGGGGRGGGGAFWLAFGLLSSGSPIIG